MGVKDVPRALHASEHSWEPHESGSRARDTNVILKSVALNNMVA